MKDLGNSALLFLTWVPEKFGPAMLAQQAAVVGVFFVDFKKDHAPRLGFVVQSVEWRGADAASDPATECDVVLRDLPVCIQRIGLVYSEVLFIFRGIGGFGTLDHDVVGTKK